MHISYLSDFENLNIQNWSGLEYNIAESLRNQGAYIDFIGTSKRDIWPIKIGERMKQVLYAMKGQRYLADRTIALCKAYGLQKSLKIKKETDIIFALGTANIAYLDSKKPMVFYTDATFHSMINYYKEFTNLCSSSIRVGHMIEKMAMDKSSLLFFASEWAAQSAINYYQVPSEKIRIIPFGANLKCNRTLEDIKIIGRKKNNKVCKLLFIGIDWYRKGGDLALEVAEILNSMGLPTELHIVGLNEIPRKNLPSFVFNHGFISKTTEMGRQQLDFLFMQSHFFILPTNAECFGIVFSEANSFGLPAISKCTGGVPTAIRNNINGFCFDDKDNANSYAMYIYDKMTRYSKYTELTLSSFNEYQTRLNWTVSGQKIINAIREI